VTVYVGVDVGGSKVLAAVVSPSGEVVRSVMARTPGRLVQASAVEDVLTDAVRAVSGGETIEAVGVAAAGFVDPAGERVVFAPHLPWRGEDLRARLAERWDTPVVLANDANCAAVAEAAYGAADPDGLGVVVTMGTGIGGAILLDGRVLRGHNGMAGEFGHMQLVPDGEPCECGGRGCWEQYSSGTALIRFARARLGHEPSVLAEACDGDPDQLTGAMVTAAAADGDLVARKAFASVGEWLGVGLANLVAALDPHFIVVGGGVSAAGNRLLDPARAELGRCVVGAGHREVPPVVAAALGPAAGAVGAAELARRSGQAH
jgi:glucokinase